MASVTDFGKEIRKLRIERGETMVEMSARVKKSPSFLSAVETGKKPVPSQLVEDITHAYGLPQKQSAQLRDLAEKSISAFRITPKTDADQSLLAALVRKLDSLTDAQRERIMEILNED
jgi:HTH-type transcriptional regulator, competence development regulator